MGHFSTSCFRSHQAFQFAPVEVEFGRSSVDTILESQFDGRRPQLVGYRTLSLPVLSPFLEAGTYFVLLTPGLTTPDGRQGCRALATLPAAATGFWLLPSLR